ncbi:hypothetical protein Cgig2_007422 [Carnegiea gigantea]|uniref:Homeobox domain-containing protein n=1 Tax=Carnegiea gigantea TaxID=171969 RepID=A0A9Q1KYB5_9CARY|nr:hypothetical protein Cgig2_007422 [Carnegiea gigantea]
MEPQQEENQISPLQLMMSGAKECEKTCTSSILCRQSSARWTPTTEQIKLLKELYYIEGLRSPTADQVHAICAQLRCYGKVEGKNVFYWFQNHKARERQRKRLTPSSTASNPTHYHNNTIIRKRGLHWKQDQDLIEQNKCPSTNNCGVPHYSSLAGVVSGGVQLVGSFGHEAVTMESKVREISILGGVLDGGEVKQNLERAGVNYSLHVRATSDSNFLDKISANGEDHGRDHDETPKTQTLPLFPMHSEEHHDHDHDHDYNHHFVPAMKTGSDGYHTSGCWWAHGTGGGASLELSLKSYGYGGCPPNL